MTKTTLQLEKTPSVVTPTKTIKHSTHEVSSHTRNLKTVQNKLKDFLKANKWTKGEYDRHLGVLMQTIPIDIIIEKNKWYHLDKQRNKLYHE